MTFTEAAVEVLRLVGKPLHYKRITEIAIERNLLSHVGKTPEVTMSSRLATMVKRDRGEAPITKVKPGVFGLREFSEEQLADLSGDVSELPEIQAEPSDETAAAAVSPSPVERRPLPGSDVFPEEEDDDEPIFGPPPSSAASSDEESNDTEDEGRGKRRRRRRKRGRGDDGDDTVTTRERDTGRDRDAGRKRGRGRDEPSGDWNRELSSGDLVGKDLADAVASVVSSSGRQGATPLRVAEQLVRRGRLSGDAVAVIPTLNAAVRADLARCQRERCRPRFRLDEGRIVWVDNLLPQDVVRAEQDVTRAADRQRERARRAFLRRLTGLPFAGLAELLATWLNAEGVVSLRAVRRPGASGGELHMAGTFKRGLEEIRLAIVVYRDGRDLGRERVIEARGALHHYGNASAAWLITTGQVLSGAREEATAPGTPPIALYDGAGLATSMARTGVGLTQHVVVLDCLDFELLDSLSGDRGVRDERRRGRGRDDRDAEREEERPRRRRERARDEERETAESEDAQAEDKSRAKADRAKAEEAQGETGEDAAEAEGGRRRRRRRRRSKDREPDELAATAVAEEVLRQDEPLGEVADDVSQETTRESSVRGAEGQRESGELARAEDDGRDEDEDAHAHEQAHENENENENEDVHENEDEDEDVYGDDYESDYEEDDDGADEEEGDADYDRWSSDDAEDDDSEDEPEYEAQDVEDDVLDVDRDR